MSEPSISDLATSIKNREITSSELVSDYLGRIEHVNGALNAVISSNTDAAVKAAAKADQLLQQGTYLGPLHGIPMTIKDSLDTADMISTWGSEGRKDYRPGQDASCVARLKAAGAILLGKTNTPEFTLSFQTDNRLFGPSKNPFDLTKTPGGSSGGAAALIAANAIPFDIGTDTAGSIRLPSHFCGIAGLKPTTGRVPCTGNALPSAGMIARLSQPGPMARNAADLAYLLPIIAGPDLIDPNCVPAPLNPYQEIDINTLRIAYHSDNGIKRPDADIVASIEQVIDLFSQAKIETTEVRPDGIEMGGFILGNVFGADGGELVTSLLADTRTDRPSRQLQEILDQPGFDINQQEFAQVIQLWDNFKSSMLAFFKHHDVLICPVNAHTALSLGASEDISAYSYTGIYNLTGWPGVVIRAGTDESGMPIGVQILSSPFREDRCLALAIWLEQRLEQALGPFSLPSTRYK